MQLAWRTVDNYLINMVGKKNNEQQRIKCIIIILLNEKERCEVRIGEKISAGKSIYAGESSSSLDLKKRTKKNL